MKKLLVWGLVLAGAVSFADAWRVEAEDFKASDGWQQGVGKDLGGGKVMVAVKRDAALSGDYRLDKAGKYHVWVRTVTYGEKWRTGELSINGKSVGMFGDEPLKEGMAKPSWHWVKLANAAELPAGKIFFSVKTPKGFVRVDSVILTEDAAFVPSDERAGIEKVKCLSPFSNSPSAVKLPAPQGQGEDVLLFHGARPWVSGAATTFLRDSGCRVTTLDSKYLDGLGGASIKVFLTDLTEPKPLDGITPAMERLSDYKLVIVTAIPPELQKKFFTPERIEKLKTYVKNGGSLMVNCHVPASLGDLLPVRLGPLQANQDNFRVKRPAGEIFSVLPEEWSCLAPFRKAELHPGAELLAPVVNGQGNQVGIFAAMADYGKGRVLFFNEDWNRKQGLRQIFSWAYGGALITGLAGRVSGIPLDPSKALYPLDPPPERKVHERLTLAVTQPRMELRENTENAAVAKLDDRREIRFANGIRIQVSADGAVDAFWKDAKVPYLRGLRAPELVFSGKLVEVDANTAEALENTKAGKTVSGKWAFQGIRREDGRSATLVFQNENGTTLEWRFKAGTLHLEGRDFAAFAERVSILKSPDMIESLKFSSQFAAGNDAGGHYARRMSCYSPPRGYAEFDLSGAKKADTWSWQFFGSGQPFTWIVSPAGIYSEFVDSPVPASPRLRVAQGDKAVSQELQLIAGYRRAPLEMPYVWHAFSPGAERGNNDWMAMYQFQRKNLREKTGLKSFAPPPTATWQNVCTQAEIDVALKTAAELGFKRIALPWCPSPIEGIDSAKSLEAYRKVRSCGLIPFPWTAGDYSHGDSEEIYRNHKDWYLRDLDGKIFSYMKIHPVLDLNNRDFRKWYFGKMSNAIKAGAGAFYFDMYGAAIGNINYGRPGAEPGLAGACDIFRFFSDRNIPIGVEGQNPLAIDNWWFRQKLYNSFQGREFSLLCASPSTGTAGDDLALDYFRTSMYGAFTYINVDGYAKGFERTPGELKMIERMGKLNPHINRAQEVVGYPFIRETPFGTVWVSDRGGALFFYDAVRELRVELPEGWIIEGVKGNVLKDVKPDSIYCLKKMK